MKCNTPLDESEEEIDEKELEEQVSDLGQTKYNLTILTCLQAVKEVIGLSHGPILYTKFIR